MSVLRKANEAESGQTLIEMAVVLPVFFLLFFGVASFAFVLFGWCNITYASRAAARYASIHSDTSLIPSNPTTISAVVTPFLYAATLGGTTTTVTYAPANTIGGTVAVAVTAKYGVTMPFTSYTSFTVSSTAKRAITR